MADSSNTVEPETNPGTAAILNRLKEIENNNQSMQATIERLHTEAQMKEEKIKALSAEKRKDMEQMIDTAIDHWLNSLTGVPEEVRKQFRQGISKIAQEADMKNAAWEVDTPFFAPSIIYLLITFFCRLFATLQRRTTATSSRLRRSSIRARSKARRLSRCSEAIPRFPRMLLASPAWATSGHASRPPRCNGRRRQRQCQAAAAAAARMRGISFPI